MSRQVSSAKSLLGHLSLPGLELDSFRGGRQFLRTDVLEIIELGARRARALWAPRCGSKVPAAGGVVARRAVPRFSCPWHHIHIEAGCSRG